MSSPSAHILNTRPAGQHLPFSNSLQALGFRVSHLPCLLIKCLPGNQLEQDPALNFDIVLFTSANAVRFAHLQRPFPWNKVAVHAIGAATASALQSLDQPLSLVPQAPFNSEAYLAQLRHLKPARLLLIKGEGGRGLIDSELKAMGWQVSSIDLYRRELPDIDASLAAQVFCESPPDIISITSNESLSNLVTLAGDYLPVLLKLPLVVNSQRAIEQAMRLGFLQTPLVADPPGDQGQLDAIVQWFRLQHQDTRLHIR